MAEIPPIKYQQGAGPELTPARPCTFDDHCSPTDAAAWVYLAEQWTEAAAAGASTREQEFSVQRLRTYVAQLKEGALECRPSFDPTQLEIYDCEPFVRELIAATERARMLVVAWQVAPPDVPGPWEIKPPVEGWPEWSLGQGGAAWRLLPWLVIGWLAYDAFGRRR